MRPGAVVVVDHGGTGIVVPHEEAEAYVSGEELGDGNQADALRRLILQATMGRVDVKVMRR